MREYEHAGELYITVSTICHKNKGLFSARNESMPAVTLENLDYVVSEGLAEIMDGSIEKVEVPGQGVRYRFNAKMEVADLAGQLDFHRNYFSGHTVLLVHSNASVVDIKRQELEALGFTVVTETQYKRAVNVLANNSKLKAPIEAVVYYYEGDGKEALDFCNTLSSGDLSFVRQIIAVSANQKNTFYRQLGEQSENVFMVDKPVGLFELESTFHVVFGDISEALEISRRQIAAADGAECVIHCFSESTGANKFVSKKLKSHDIKVCTYTNEQALLESLSARPDVVLVDLADVKVLRKLVKDLRENEKAGGAETLIPVLGLAAGEDGDTKAVYELGLDDNVDLHKAEKSAIDTIRYWATLH